MSKTEFSYEIEINRSPEDVFAYVSDLAKHGEWNDNLTVESTGEGPAAVGSQYHSRGKMMGRWFDNDLRVVGFDAPNRFSFISTAGDDEFQQEFAFTAEGDGTVLHRKLTIDLNPFMAGMFKAVIGPLVSNPSMNKGLKNLKAKLEQG